MSITKITVSSLCAALLAAAFAANVTARQKASPATPPAVVESMYGPDLYRRYCAACHGREGRGDGPVASALKVPPPDLTGLAQRRNAAFPSLEVERIIRGGGALSAHGSDEMPVWGPIFLALDPSDARVRVRIAALVSHLASIQQK